MTLALLPGPDPAGLSMGCPVGCSWELVMCWARRLPRSARIRLASGPGRSAHGAPGPKAAAPGLPAFTEISIPAAVWPP
jgi:hypothetical protein